ncbi:hypothetical protein Droror1_Dr00003827 [Drosera rotundifolia]
MESNLQHAFLKISTEEINHVCDDHTQKSHDNDEASTHLYDCVFCKQGFTSAQALGGHMNIHRKDRASMSSRRVIKQGDDHATHHHKKLQTTMMNLNHSAYFSSPLQASHISNTPMSFTRYLSVEKPCPDAPFIPEISVGREFQEVKGEELDLELRLGNGLY